MTTKTPAPIEYHHKSSNDRSVVSTIKDNHVIKQSQSSQVIDKNYNENDYIIPGPSPIEDKKIIYHEVAIGETIEDIALKYKQNIEEIATLNDLYPPYYLDEFQIIKIKVAKSSTLPAKPKQQSKVKEVQSPDFIKPVKGKLISQFGSNTPYGKNKGINIAAKAGTKVVSAANGKVIYADYDATFGYLVIIKVTGKNIVTSYAHLEDIILSKGDLLKQSDVVGYVGNTGKVKTSQLHFGIREGKNAKNPLDYVNY